MYQWWLDVGVGYKWEEVIHFEVAGIEVTWSFKVKLLITEHVSVVAHPFPGMYLQNIPKYKIINCSINSWIKKVIISNWWKPHIVCLPEPLSCKSDSDGPYFFQLWSSVLEKNSVRIYIWISRQLARLNLNIIVKIYKAQQMLHKNLSWRTCRLFGWYCWRESMPGF